MKLNYLCALALFIQPVIQISAQSYLTEENVIDLKIDSLSRIVEDLNNESNEINLESNIKKSWSRNTFFRISTSKTTMEANASDNEFYTSSSELCLDGTNKGENNYKFESSSGVAIMWGRNCPLHKKAIANVVKFALDYTWIDLNWNKYNKVYSKDKKFDSSVTYKGLQDFLYYMPWGLEKNIVNYGMSLGPSLTIAPCGTMKTKYNLMCMHFQVFFHVGYNASVIFMKNDDSLDVQQKGFDGFLGEWGHGLSKSWGMNFSWKSIGIGFEKRKGDFSYKPFDGKFGEEKVKYHDSNCRWYITLNF